LEAAEKAVAGQWFSSHHVIAATDKHATTEELLEVVFTVQCRGYITSVS
jgi:hypothetical protein